MQYFMLEYIKQELNAIHTLVTDPKKRKPKLNSKSLNKDGIPYNLLCIGVTKQKIFTLIVGLDNKYYVGNQEYDSLSSAALAVSGNRRSGWVFWKTEEGETLKSLYKK